MLYIVATPIGNLSEMSSRAIDTLNQADLIAAEDTRHSKKLLDHFNIKTKMVAYQKFNEKASAAGLISLIKQGKTIALISDAGMPIISDPGSILVAECIKEDIQISVISGPSACINALVLSGFDCAEFAFLGFLPDKKSLKDAKIAPYLRLPCPLVFYSPQQSVQKDLSFLFEKLGNREVIIARELTKKFEQVKRGVLGGDLNIKPAGEFVIVVSGFKGENLNDIAVIDLVNEYLKMGLSKMDAIKSAAKDKALPKSQVYQLFLENEEKAE
ncbi:MAG: 16S rRNA (cytidine(1402)-2'-O)-methyltransferase [Firmicutes bacterium]|nr:16S rRNA (cytidine(1402)-2'-O)-methyltransferase [Bacillota bacterium]